MTCPEPQELTALLDGELTENRGAWLRSHATGCRGCAGELELQRRLLARLAAPVPGAPSEDAVAGVMGRLDAADAATAVPSRGGRRRWAWAVLATAAAAAVLLVLVRPAGPDAEFAARGGAATWTQQVGVELWTLQDGPRRLAAGMALPPGVPVVASYSNVGPGPAWLLAFAVDARGEVHWLYPGFQDASQDPQATRLEGAVVQRALPESVVLEGVPGGALRLVTVVTREPLRVSAIESARAGDLTVEALRRRWPAARVDELVVRSGVATAPERP